MELVILALNHCLVDEAIVELLKIYLQLNSLVHNCAWSKDVHNRISKIG